MITNDAVDIETGEVVHIFRVGDEDYEYGWWAEGKRKSKKLLKDKGYEYVSYKFNKYHGGITIYVKKMA